jgi:2-polyprenyl-3-methyl-5-hydroxy-6-metoxy-1,4-benzoquinol methylase
LKNLIIKKIERIFRYSPTYHHLIERIEGLNTSLEQQNAILSQFGDLPYLPPPNLQKRIVGGYFPDYIQSGFQNISDFNNALSGLGRSLRDFDQVLDFGCGCGRILLAVKKAYPKLSLHGADIDQEAIDFCNKHYDKWGKFYVNPDCPPSSMASNSIDLVYGISVFTHLPEDFQFLWLKELNRVTQINGILLLTVENEKINFLLNLTEKDQLESKGYFYKEGKVTEGLPEYYQTAIHTHAYIHKEWSKYFEILNIIPLGMGNHQDIIVCRKTFDK